MIIGVGIDAVEVSWVNKQLEIEGWREEVFSPAEVAYCESKRYPARHYGARLAAREAFLKALGTGAVTIDEFRLVWVDRRDNGQPFLKVEGAPAERMAERGIAATHLSMSHTASIATAVVLLESTSAPPDISGVG